MLCNLRVCIKIKINNDIKYQPLLSRGGFVEIKIIYNTGPVKGNIFNLCLVH